MNDAVITATADSSLASVTSSLNLHIGGLDLLRGLIEHPLIAPG
jgi:hypothetical protein